MGSRKNCLLAAGMSKGFDSFSHVRQLPNTDWWQLTADLGYYVQDSDLRIGLSGLTLACAVYGVDPSWSGRTGPIRCLTIN